MFGGLQTQILAQNLADIRLRQIVAEFDVPRHFVTGELLFAGAPHGLGGERGIAAHDGLMVVASGLSRGVSDPSVLPGRACRERRRLRDRAEGIRG